MADFEWKEVQRGGIPDGTKLLLKMRDAKQNLSYAIGIVDHRTGKLEILAQEDKAATDAIFWVVIS